MNPCIATIVAPNYLAYARVLGESLREHMPQAVFRVLVVGRKEGGAHEAVAASGLDVTWASELGLAGFEQLAFRFDVTEFATALKPSFLKHLLAEGHDTVIYLDPDIRVFRPLDPVLEALQGAEAVLTPHACAPVMDGKRPSDIDFMRSGAYNLGFAAFARGTSSAALLDWWESRCLSNGLNDPGFGTFVDQKWMDLAPCYFERVRVLRHRGCNVAYWNLHERPLAEAEGGLTAGGDPLCFFHFSGVDATKPQLLSRHQNRHLPATGSLLDRLVRDYCARLLAAGHARWSALPYPFGRLSDGSEVTPLMRRAAVALGDGGPGDPFDAGGPLQRRLRAAGIGPGRRSPAARATTTLNFDPDDRRVRAVHLALRALARLIGADRAGDLLRYASFLGWRGNYPAVLLHEPLRLEHTDDRKERRP